MFVLSVGEFDKGNTNALSSRYIGCNTTDFIQPFLRMLGEGFFFINFFLNVLPSYVASGFNVR